MTMHRRILRLSSANCFRIVAFLALAGAASTVRAAECEWTRSGAVRVTPQGQATYMIGQVPATHRVQLRDGFAAGGYGESGLFFDARGAVEGDPQGADAEVRAWNGRPDIMSANKRLFVPRFAAPFDKNHELDAGAVGGFHSVRKAKIDGGVACSTDELDYDYHWLPRTGDLRTNEVYCIRSRNGQNYALLMVEQICDGGIRFRYAYNGPNPNFAPAAPPAPPLR